ncbi:MAG: hypothetical protein ABI670_05725 [Chloroflexota bacterium]
MATATANQRTTTAAAPPAQATSQPVSGNARVGRLRSFMLTVIASAISFGLLAGLLAWQANVATYNAYHNIVDEGSVSVDSALRARSAALDHMSAAATFLETTGDVQQQARNRATERWADYNNESRVTWRNLTDPTHGEADVFAAADRASSDYIQQIGAMFSYYATGDADKAGQAFLQARETLNTRLVPALGGLEAVKVEGMETAYAGAEQLITRWRYVLIGAAVILLLIFLGGLVAVRRMHYKWSWPVGAALLVCAALALLMQFQLGQASADARVMVREAYDNVAGVQDTAALLSQGRALESIAIFDPKQSALHLGNFDQYNALVEQRLCGPRDCTAQSFLAGGDAINAAVVEAALEEQSKLGLARPPLVANVHFPGQAAAYEQFRVDYRQWLDAHNTLAQQVTAGQLQAASATSTGDSATTFARVTESANAAAQVARSEYDKIWQGVYWTTGVNQALALIFPIAGLLAAWGVWQRRSQLFA